MAEYAGKGIAGTGLGLGIAGTALGLLQNNGGGLLNGLLGGGNNTMANNTIDTLRSEIAELKAQKYSDAVGLEVYKLLRDRDVEVGNRFNDVYKELSDSKVREATLRGEINTTTAILNGKIDNVATAAQQGIACNSTAITNLQNLISSLTKVVVPNSSVCPGWGTVTITPATTTTTTA